MAQTPAQLAQAEKASQSLGLGTVEQARQAISPDSLTPKTNFKVVPPETPTTSTRQQTELETPTQYTQDTQDLQSKAETAGTASTQSFEDLLVSMLTPGSTELTDKAYKTEGVDTKLKELNQYDQQLNIEQNSLRRQIERIQDNQEGLSDTQINNRVSEVTRDSLRTQADIAVIRAGVAQDYSTAKAIADRAVSVQLERDKIKNNALLLNYQENKSLFDKAEQRAFESAQADRERKYKEEETRLQTISDFSIEALKAGAPTAVVGAIRGAKTLDEAISLGGDYLRPKVSPKLRSTQVIEQGGRKLLIDTQTGEVIKEFTGLEANLPVEELQQAQNIDEIDTIDSLKTHAGLNSSVGPIPGTRTALADAFGAKDEFIGSVEQLTSGLSLQALIDAKAQGATFGALSNAELRLLSQSATKINKWAKTEDGKAVGEGDATSYYDVSEKAFKKELDEISYYKKQDAILRGVPPEQLSNVQIMPDGKVYSLNSDGSLSELRTK